MIYCVGELDIYCRFQLMFDQVDQIYTVDRIYRILVPLASNVPSSTTTSTTTTVSTTTLTDEEDFIEDDELDESGTTSYIDYILENANLVNYNYTDDLKDLNESNDIPTTPGSYYEHILENAGIISVDYLNQENEHDDELIETDSPDFENIDSQESSKLGVNVTSIDDMDGGDIFSGYGTDIVFQNEESSNSSEILDFYSIANNYDGTDYTISDEANFTQISENHSFESNKHSENYENLLDFPDIYDISNLTTIEENFLDDLQGLEEHSINDLEKHKNYGEYKEDNRNISEIID